ncbi:hypothetical protein J1605_014787 [Eschrichtius robustus]|uniref:Interleukin-4 n=1 Tax=Eschrichtius robustus TaxID=9764 RepID=A0AB34GCF1_ESCRO|nr:hypothetical protein J1605_014787 [Eschrichtius robustus]
MGLTSQLIPMLVCLLACTSNFVHGHKCDITLQEIIKTLNILTARKVSKLSGTISPDVLVMLCIFLRLESELLSKAYPVQLEVTLVSCSLVPAWAKNSCMELPVADVFAAPKNTTEKETFCRAATVLRHIYGYHKCLNKPLNGLHRNLSSMANMTCSVNEAKKSTLKDFLERLKTIMKEKYSKC